jgi:uncharacterized protein YqgC (DUF456 family)
MEPLLVISITVILIAIGLLGSVLPFLPGSPLILLGAFMYAWYTQFAVVGWGVLGTLIALTIMAQVFDYCATMIGAQKYGAGPRGIAGAFCCGIIGIFFGGIVGVIIGPFIGAALGELLGGRTAKDSMKIGFGTLVGFVGGAIGKLIISLTMVGVFLWAVLK